MKYLLAFILMSFTTISDRMLIMGDSISVYSYGWQEKLCKNKGLECVNIAKGAMRTDWMLKTLRGHLDEKDLADGIHLSAKGHRTYVSYLSNFIF